MPRFPLAHISWRKALQDRRKRVALTVAEGLAAEDHEVTERAEGAQVFRAARFWGRSATIYLSYKKMQAKCALELPRVANLEERELKRKEWWDGIHELNSDRMLKLCLDLRGFYLKSGQFLGTRHDFMPKIFLRKLGKLHDDVPPMAASHVSKVLARELDVPAEELFSSLNLTHPIGSASISQVHRGVIRETGEKVAVKVQYPGAERVMMSDLRNLKILAWFLQKFELNFDILSSLKELSRQIKGEFDFRSEATTMDRMHESLGEHSRRINLPTSRSSTKRVLIMSYLEGESLAQLKRGGKERFNAARKRIGKSLLHELADAWGFMIFEEGLFNADPHPGNILIMPEEQVGPIKRGFGLLGLRTPKLRIGLLDWGQTKELGRQDREKVANLILAVSSHASPDIVRCFNGLGVKLSNPDDADSIEKLALVMFDTRTIKGLDFNPFSDNNVLKLNSVLEYPQDLYFILRTVLMFRGMAQSLGVEFSLADKWAPHARRLLACSG
ncbi:ABC transporter-like protein [Ectocarpus siliculosus]|uniref:ABC transporter-like protein n=1 Tax=Ectocarpus siliculosus TaxID=2880 RepID=D8LK44_ECTSI|nr:ABC transporter-like protein [Ectocarpus siliculosus]|eukprot:CBN74513.1 ABC transporter-like protein [Ectocarpus siliculosus]